MAYSPFIPFYGFPEQIEVCWQAILNSALAANSIGGVRVSISKDPALLTTPRIELQFTTGPAMAQRTTAGQTGQKKQTPNAFEGTLGVKLSTTRPIPNGNAELHVILYGLIMYELSPGARRVNGTNLPNLQIMDMVLENTHETVFDPKEQDETTFLFHLWFAINNGVWPSA